MNTELTAYNQSPKGYRSAYASPPFHPDAHLSVERGASQAVAKQNIAGNGA